jgi:hypothetical protein
LSGDKIQRIKSRVDARDNPGFHKGNPVPEARPRIKPRFQTELSNNKHQYN